MLKIPPDYTFLVQIALFVVFWLAMKRFWFGPAMRIIKERAARSEGAIREAKAVQADAERLRAEQGLAQARARLAEEVAAARQGLRVQVEEIARDVVRKVLGRAA